MRAIATWPVLLSSILYLACANPGKNKNEAPAAPGASGSGGAVGAGTADGAGGATNPTTGQAVVGQGGSAGNTTGAGGSPTGTGAGGANPPPAGGGSGPACGSRTCAAGQVCCNPSCGICTPPDGFCTQQVCDPGDAAAGTPATCRQDADCRLFSDYCTGCDCRALAREEKDPGCSGPGVRCLVDPCQNKAAACQGGKCLVVNKTGAKK